MQKTRVYKIAQELNITSKELIEKLEALDIKVTNHMSSLSMEEAEVIMELLGDKKEKKEDEMIDTKKHQQKEEKIETKVETKVEHKTAPKVEHKTKPTTEKVVEKEVIKEEVVEEKQVDPSTEALIIGDTILVGELAKKLDVAASEIILKIIKLGIMANINQEIKFETAEKIAVDYDIQLEREEKEEEEADKIIEEDDVKDLKPRPPIVTVMGHVDHGKTSLLDSIRNTRVTDKEAGGITQHIGASEVTVNGKKVVFLDTPGHEAFTEMRSRGAKVTDIAILVVAADDGIMPQTVEAINHSKAAGVPIIIAINKTDKPTANVEKVRQELSEKGLLVEEWGGDVIDVPVSAKTGDNIETLLEMVLLVAEMEELKANPDRNAVGTVIESNLDKGRGPVATVIVANGTLKVGDAIVAGSSYGKVRAMINDKGKRIKKAPPSTPVEILGLNEVPNAGDQFVVLNSDKAARILGEKRKEKIRDVQMKATSKISLEDLFEQMQHGELKELNIIVKADVQGSVEAVRQSIEKLSNEEVSVKVIHGGVGAITESDIMLASASNAIVIGFNVRPSTGATTLVEREKVDLRTYRIIYEAIEDIEKAMKGMLDPEFVEENLGKAEIRLPFKVPNAGMVAGSYVLSGKISRNAKARLVRDGIVVYDGTIDSLRRFKDDVKDVATGYECGIGLTNYNDIKEGDIIEAYIIKEVERK